MIALGRVEAVWRAPPIANSASCPLDHPFSLAGGHLTLLIQELVSYLSRCNMSRTHSSLVFPFANTPVSPPCPTLKLSSFTVQYCSPINKIWIEYFFFCSRADSTYSVEVVEGFLPLCTSHQAGFAVIKFY